MIGAIRSLFLAEREQWIVWLPVFFASGIAFYFLLPVEPALSYSIAWPTLSLVTACYFWKHPLWRWGWLCIFLAGMGFLNVHAKALWVHAPTLQSSIGVKQIEGTISEIHTRPTGKRFFFTDLVIESMASENTPKMIRLNVSTHDGNARIGDRVSLLAALNPPPKAVIPYGYNFAMHAYFQTVGGVGYAVSDLEVIAPAKGYSFLQDIERLRHSITERILAITPKREGNIITALLVGERGGIEKRDLEAMRESGLAHLLAISGMHLALVATIFFFSSRALMALSQRLALRYPIKKWAAFIAIVGSFGYLLISGQPISAQRAFIMSSLFLLAITLDRTGTPLRSVALAAMIVLLWTPQSLITPSFQMSFAAVIVLVAMVDVSRPLIEKVGGFGWFKKILIYISGTIFASLVAGLATAPFAMYHFNQFSSYGGIIANMAAVPLTSFIIMPLGVIGLLLMPLGLDALPFMAMAKAIDLLLAVAQIVADLPKSFTTLPSMPTLSLVIMTLGGLWLCLWKRRWRFLGIPFMSLAAIPIALSAQPDMLIDQEAELFAVNIPEHGFVFSQLTSGRYTRNIWGKYAGQQESIALDEITSPHIQCDPLGCLFHKNNQRVALAFHPIALHEDCPKVDVLINLTFQKTPCYDPSTIINRWDLKDKGTHALYLHYNTITLTTTEDEIGQRLWN